MSDPRALVDERHHKTAVNQAGCGGFIAGFVVGLLVMSAFVLLSQHLQLGWRW